MLSELISMMTWTVTQLNDYVHQLIAKDETLQGLLVEGEISNFKKYPSGHWYFSLKDEQSTIRCVMFRQNNRSVPFPVENGMRVIVGGYASLYTRDGAFQLYAMSMQQQGVGALYEQFEAIKQRLMNEGLCAVERKRKIPAFPRRVGVVTSPAGAVIRDIIQVSSRRNPGVDILLAPVSVQGDTAAREMMDALDALNAIEDIDVIILGRGGGSMEDLWAFNDESLARAVAASRVPVITAVGHETDTTIVDYVSDLRAPTPSAAAELAVPLRDEWLQTVDLTMQRIDRQLHQRLERLSLRLTNGVHGLQISAPQIRLQQIQQRLLFSRQSISRLMEHRFKLRQQAYNVADMKFQTFAPANMLKRGYVLITDAQGNRLTTRRQAIAGQSVAVQFHDGYAHAVWQEETYEKEH